jgi:RNA polymerase sigma-70 factor (ECF subfamily)
MQACEVVELPGNERDQLLAARDGDDEAGRHLISGHGPSMLRTAWSVLGKYGGTEAEDVVQEAFIAALTTPALPRGDVGAWLRAITVRKALDQVRKRSGRGETAPIEIGDESARLAAPGNPEAALDVLTVRRGLAMLSPTDRAVLVLVDLEGHSMAEAAQAIGSTRVAVKLRAVRARRRLARLLRSRETTAEGKRR